MKEFVISEAKAETAVLVGLITQQQDEAKTKEYLDELEFLADTAGAVTVKRFTQKMQGPSQVTYVGKGKLDEIKQYIKQCQDEYDEWLDNGQCSMDNGQCSMVNGQCPQPVGMVIFDDELSAKQIRNIAAELKVKIPLYAAPSAASVDPSGASGRRLWFRRRQGFRGFAWTW